MIRLILAVFSLSLISAAPIYAQKNELSLSAGGGRLVGDTESRSASAYTLAYTRYLTDQWAVEGGLELFFVTADDNLGVQAAVLYHFRPTGKDQRWTPYLTAGIGNTSTDPTEIPSVVVIRLGGGLKYFFGQSQKFGLRFEARNEIIGKDNTVFFPQTRINFPSARVGVIYRF